ncbi:zinc ribbon domain-containing protein [Butyrivibrio sp. XB500-5]|uniref:zinc ribbon domain-containing protein n=1 Tax=Butyrivibrio sp. XB500-5 TaxID=2364880 RepID=UPI0011C239DF|nr:zinc ribbon domain-containing protein [Butyrivibrio sp. XB500-5]
MKCNNCGHEVKEKLKYCPICGNPMISIDDSGWEKIEVEEKIFKDVPEDDQDKYDAVEQYNIKKKKEIRKEKGIVAVILTVLFVFIACLFIIPNFWSVYYTFKSPVVSKFIDPDSDIVNLAENNGVIYNNRGKVNSEFKDNLSNMIYIPAGHIGIVVDNDNNLYFINCEDLTTEYIDHAVGYSCSYYGAVLYYIDDGGRLKVNDLANRKSWIHKTNNEVVSAAMSPNSGYLCCEETWYDVNNGQQYKVCIVDKNDNVIYEYTIGDEFYDLLGMSNDGDTVYMCSYSLGRLYCLHDKRLKTIYWSNIYNADQLYLNSEQNKLLFVNNGKVYYHVAGEEECKEVFTGTNCMVYPKANVDIIDNMHFILEEDFDGYVICEQGFGNESKYYWLNEDIKPIPFAKNDIEYTVETVTTDKHGYKFLYTYGSEIHYATLNDGKSGDVTLKDIKDPVLQIVSDNQAVDIWISTAGNKIYHVRGDAIEQIYEHPISDGEDPPELAYDSLTEFLYYTTPDNKLIGVDKEDEVKMLIKGVKGFVQGTEDSGDIIFEFKGGAEYRIIFDKLIRFDDQ